MGWGCSPWPGEWCRGRRELGVPGERTQLDVLPMDLLSCSILGCLPTAGVYLQLSHALLALQTLHSRAAVPTISSQPKKGGRDGAAEGSVSICLQPFSTGAGQGGRSVVVPAVEMRRDEVHAGASRGLCCVCDPCGRSRACPAPTEGMKPPTFPGSLGLSALCKSSRD